MADRTVTAFSLSKTYALAGLRLGYVVAAPPVMHAIRKVANHSVYNVPAALQRAGLAALEGGAAWIDGARARYRAARDLASRGLSAPHFLPDGGAYLFLDLTRYLPEGDDPLDRKIDRLHDRLLDGGVAVSPGLQFGTRYAAHARLCYTALPIDQLEAGVARLSQLLGD
jgi:aspartate/methionine/tyrosine aminotransferase